MIKTYSSFIKFGEKEYMERLYNYGEIFCKPIDYFTKIDETDYRGDKNDGIAYIKQIRNLKLSYKKQEIGMANYGQLFGRNPSDKGNIYCLFGLESSTLNWESKTTQKLILDLNNLGFGDTAVLIFDPAEFVKRVTHNIKQSGYKVDFSPIVYLDYSSYEGELSPFNKSDKYKGQSEVRFWIPNKKNHDLVFNIGSIADISAIISRDKLDKLEYEIE